MYYSSGLNYRSNICVTTTPLSYNQTREKKKSNKTTALAWSCLMKSRNTLRTKFPGMSWKIRKNTNRIVRRVIFFFFLSICRFFGLCDCRLWKHGHKQSVLTTPYALPYIYHNIYRISLKCFHPIIMFFLSPFYFFTAWYTRAQRVFIVAQWNALCGGCAVAALRYTGVPGSHEIVDSLNKFSSEKLWKKNYTSSSCGR